MMNTSMFIIGFVIFSMYIWGLIYMINWGHKSQENDQTKDPELDNQTTIYLDKSQVRI